MLSVHQVSCRILERVDGRAKATPFSSNGINIVSRVVVLRTLTVGHNTGPGACQTGRTSLRYLLVAQPAPGALRYTRIRPIHISGTVGDPLHSLISCKIPRILVRHWWKRFRLLLIVPPTKVQDPCSRLCHTERQNKAQSAPSKPSLPLYFLSKMALPTVSNSSSVVAAAVCEGEQVGTGV